jgi:hypothetical protein
VSSIPAEAISSIAGAIFALGVAWAVLRQTRRDLNGLGRRTKRVDTNLILWLLVVTEKREDRALLVELLREP